MAERLVEISSQAIERRGKFIISLSGGSTPSFLYSLLAKPPFRDQFCGIKPLFFGVMNALYHQTVILTTQTEPEHYYLIMFLSLQ